MIHRLQIILKSNFIKKRCSEYLLQEDASSLPSAQSTSPSHTHTFRMHCPLWHLNSFSLHLRPDGWVVTETQNKKELNIVRRPSWFKCWYVFSPVGHFYSHWKHGASFWCCRDCVSYWMCSHGQVLQQNLWNNVAEYSSNWTFCNTLQILGIPGYTRNSHNHLGSSDRRLKIRAESL